MKVEVRKSFEKDINKLADKKLANRLFNLIAELEDCESILEVKHVKKMKATNDYYRVRMGDYRLGIKLEHNSIVLLRFMHRKEIYNYFP